MANSEGETKRPPLLFLLLILFLFISFFFFYLNFFTFIINTSFIVCFICRFVFFFLLVFISVLRHHLLPPPLVPIHFLCYHLLNLRPLLHLPRPLLLMRWTSAVPSFLIQWRREEVSKLDYIKVQTAENRNTRTNRQTDRKGLRRTETHRWPRDCGRTSGRKGAARCSIDSGTSTPSRTRSRLKACNSCFM